jgi:ATP phosphoribosyltransferase regulatory subunit
MMQKKQLLPVGFYDLLFEEAEKSYKNIDLALNNFLQKGYRLIKTPLVEFEDSKAHKENSFYATDVISGNNIVFRNDITLQISRLLNTRLVDEKLPLKLCYVGDVLYAKNNELYANRQQTQVGLEIIGCVEEKSNFEVVDNLLVTLKKLNLKNLLIEFSLPDFLEIFLAEISAENKDELRQAIIKKNISLVRNLAAEVAEIISYIMLSNHDLPSIIARVSTEMKSPKILAELQRAKKIHDYFEQNHTDEIQLRFDLFGDHKSSYHNQISFDVFCKNFSYPIARGGRYKINNLSAVGATIYMNHLLRVG